MNLLQVVRQRARADWPALGALAAITLATCLLLAAAPRALTNAFDEAIQQAIAEAPPSQRDVVIDAPAVIAAAANDPVAPIVLAGSSLDQRLPASLQRVLSPPAYAAETATYKVADVATGRFVPPNRFLNVRIQDGFADRVRYVSGRAPRPSGTRLLAAGVAFPSEYEAQVVEIVLSQQAATMLRLPQGTTLLGKTDTARSGVPQPAVFVVVGVFEPLDAAADYWEQRRQVLTPRFESLPNGDLQYFGYASTDPLAYRDVLTAHQPGQLTYSWRFSPDAAAFTADSVREIGADLDRLASGSVVSASNLPILGGSQYGQRLTVRGGLAKLLDDFSAQRSTALRALALVAATLAGLALVVGALAVQLTTERRRAGVVLLAARGASHAQLAGSAAVEALAIVGSAGVAGWLLGTLLAPGDAGPVPAVLAAVVVGAGVALLSATAVHAARDPARPGRRDRWRRLGRSLIGAQRRLIAELLVVAVAIVGVLLVRRRGVDAANAANSVDIFLVSVPILLAIAAALLAVRVYPLPMRGLARAAARRPGAVAFLGFARAGREGIVAALPLLAMVTALGSAVFAGVVATTVRAGQTATAWQLVGADARVESTGFQPDEIAAVTNVAGVEGAVSAYDDRDATVGESDVSLHALAVDVARFDSILGPTPVGQLPGDLSSNASGTDEPIPAVVSPELAEAGVGSEISAEIAGRPVRLRIAEVREQFPAVQAGQQFAVVSLDGLRAATGLALAPTSLLLRGADASPAELRAVAERARPGATVASRAEAYAAVTSAPLIDETLTAFRIAVVVAAGYALLAVLLTFVLTGPARSRFLSGCGRSGWAAPSPVGWSRSRLARSSGSPCCAGSSWASRPRG